MPRRDVPVLPEMARLPERLCRVMDLDGVTQEALSLKCGQLGAPVSQSTISKLRNGENLKGVQCAVVAVIAKALGVQVGWLIFGEGETIPRVETPLPSSSVRKSSHP